MKKILGMVVVIGVLAAGLLAAGCGNNKNSPEKTGEGGKNQDQPPISSEPRETPVKVTLYFSDDQAMKLVTEEREVNKGGETIEEVIVKELIKGPENPDHIRTVPEEAELLSVEVVDGIAYVNFSREFKTKHWGGSTGESMTLMSVTNSLCELEGIEKVQFLLEGDKMDTLAGHMITSEPLEPSYK